MAAAAVLPDREMDKRGQARGRRRKREEARSALSNSISIGLHGGWPAVRARNPLEIRIYAPRDRMSRAEIVRDSVCQRASSSTRHREVPANMSIGIERGNRCPRSRTLFTLPPAPLFFIRSLGSWSNRKRCRIGLKLEHALRYRTRLIGFRQLNSGQGKRFVVSRIGIVFFYFPEEFFRLIPDVQMFKCE